LSGFQAARLVCATGLDKDLPTRVGVLLSINIGRCSMAQDLETSEGRRNVELVMKYLDAVEAKDKAALMHLVTEESEIEIPFNEGGIVEDGYFKKYKGLKALDAVFQGLTTSFDDDGIQIFDRPGRVCGMSR
jgi:hypothetical protein